MIFLISPIILNTVMQQGFLNSRDYRRIEQAIIFMSQHYAEGVSGAAVAAELGLSEFHFRRLFRGWAGIPPERFIRYLAKEHAVTLLKQSTPILGSSLEAGFSGPSRLTEALVAFDSLTPGEIASRGEGVQIIWGIGPSPFGDALVSFSARGVTELQFLPEALPPGSAYPGTLQHDLPRADLCRDDAGAAERLGQIFAPDRGGEKILLTGGTNFQVKIWEALLRIPAGTLASYTTLAAAAGSPRAVRAAGSAIGANRVAWLIPCHRVIRASGETGNYRWGIFRKQTMLAWEAARSRRTIRVP